MKTYNQLIHEYKKRFYDLGLYPETVKSFLFELCNQEQVSLYRDLDSEVDSKVFAKFNDGIGRLLDGEPLNYVLGYSYFYGYKLKVNSDVLIPRYETEELVGYALSKYDLYFPNQKINVADVATGCGAIAIALKKEENNLSLFASDVSYSALEVAKENALNNQCSINFLLGSMLDPFIENDIKVDILVANPPYIKADEQLEHSVVDYEPHIALFGGDDGLKFYRMIFSKAIQVLNSKGMMLFEMGYDQKENMIELAKSYFPESEIEVKKDINGKDRMFFIKLNS